MEAEEAWALLQDFTAKEARGLAQPLLNSRDSRRRLRDALLVSGWCGGVAVGRSLRYL